MKDTIQLEPDVIVDEQGTDTVHHAIQKGWESPFNNLVVVDESILITRPYCHLAGSGVSPLPYQ